jgi:transcriptional regulator with XRE-family HTH domain
MSYRNPTQYQVPLLNWKKIIPRMLEGKDWTLRECAAEIGVSFQTLSLLQRGENIDLYASKGLAIIKAYLEVEGQEQLALDLLEELPFHSKRSIPRLVDESRLVT